MRTLAQPQISPQRAGLAFGLSLTKTGYRWPLQLCWRKVLTLCSSLLPAQLAFQEYKHQQQETRSIFFFMLLSVDNKNLTSNIWGGITSGRHFLWLPCHWVVSAQTQSGNYGNSKYDNKNRKLPLFLYVQHTESHRLKTGGSSSPALQGQLCWSKVGFSTKTTATAFKKLYICSS